MAKCNNCERLIGAIHLLYECPDLCWDDLEYETLDIIDRVSDIISEVKED